MSGAGSAAGSARRGRGSRAREAIEARRHGLAACRDQRNLSKFFSINLLLLFFGRIWNPVHPLVESALQMTP